MKFSGTIAAKEQESCGAKMVFPQRGISDVFIDKPWPVLGLKSCETRSR